MHLPRSDIVRQKISLGSKKAGVGKWMLGRKLSEETKKRISQSNSGKHNSAQMPTDEKHWNWRGDKVSYRALHHWIVRNKGKATKCSNDIRHQAKRYCWANISQEYKRDLNDFRELCNSCNLREGRKL